MSVFGETDRCASKEVAIGIIGKEFGVGLFGAGVAIALAGPAFGEGWVSTFLVVGGLVGVAGPLLTVLPKPRQGARGLFRFLGTDVGQVRDAGHVQGAIAQTVRASPDANKVRLIDRLYPLVFDLSEVAVDTMGNVSGDWRGAFLQGEGRQYFERVNSEYRKVGESFSVVRTLAAKHGQYIDVVNLVEGIADFLNQPGQALSPLRSKAEMLEFRFTERSIELIADDVHEFHKAIGRLRLHLSRECLPLLSKLRSDAL